jgi:hypothetical protein
MDRRDLIAHWIMRQGDPNRTLPFDASPYMRQPQGGLGMPPTPPLPPAPPAGPMGDYGSGAVLGPEELGAGGDYGSGAVLTPEELMRLGGRR